MNRHMTKGILLDQRLNINSEPWQQLWATNLQPILSLRKGWQKSKAQYLMVYSCSR